MNLLDQIDAHLQTFSDDLGIDPDEVFVLFRLANGAAFYARGLRFDLVADDIAMIRGSAPEQSTALVVFRDHIVTAEFQTNSFEKPQIGFHSEINP